MSSTFSITDCLTAHLLLDLQKKAIAERYQNADDLSSNSSPEESFEHNFDEMSSSELNMEEKAERPRKKLARVLKKTRREDARVIRFIEDQLGVTINRTRETRQVCPVRGCDMTTHKDALARHCLTHVKSNNLYPCGQCEETFSSSFNRTRHVARKHLGST